MHRFNLFMLAAAGLTLLAFSAVATTPDGKGFPSSDAAAQALLSAAKADDAAAVLEILGPAAKSIVTTNDAVADKKNFTSLPFAPRRK